MSERGQRANFKAEKLKSGMLKAEMLTAEIKIPPIVFQQERLREKVIEYFGFEAFKKRLSEIISETRKR